jgi:CubicO group peptidase (beta-lactamase class C family)
LVWIDEPLRFEDLRDLDYVARALARQKPALAFGASQSAFGTPGAGGSFAFADPDSRLGFAYVMNNMDYDMFDDPRE